MKTENVVAALVSLLFIAGCSSPARTPDHLMKLPPDQVFEVRHTASVPAAVAYKNVIRKARQCWQRTDRFVDADSFISRNGQGRISVKALSDGAMTGLALVAVEVSRDTETTTRLTGRSLVATSARAGDLQNLQLWAEGKEVPCSQ